MGWMEMLSKGNYVSYNYILHTKHPNPSQAVTANLVLVHFPTGVVLLSITGIFSLSEGITVTTAPRLLSCHLQQDILMDEAHWLMEPGATNTRGHKKQVLSSALQQLFNQLT